jgi:hypothetical protein
LASAFVSNYGGTRRRAKEPQKSETTEAKGQKHNHESGKITKHEKEGDFPAEWLGTGGFSN